MSTEFAMSSNDLRKGIHRTVMTLGMAFLLIGVVLLTVSDKVFILGICFLGVGGLAVLCYLLVTVSTCVKKRRRTDEENTTESENRQAAQRQIEPETAQFDAPRYEDVILCGSATVWTVTLGPPPDIEPPPYYSELALRRGAVTDLRLQNPVLLRVSSDIHEVKRAGILPESYPEPLTPPPTYNETVTEWEEDFESLQEEG